MAARLKKIEARVDYELRSAHGRAVNKKIRDLKTALKEI